MSNVASDIDVYKHAAGVMQEYGPAALEHTIQQLAYHHAEGDWSAVEAWGQVMGAIRHLSMLDAEPDASGP